jgi:histone deacetylase 1/2
VAKGYHQQPGLDFTETFSPMVKANTIRLVLSLAITQQWTICQIDIQNAFLHGQLQEEVYMQQPQGYVHPNFPHHVCRLKKSLYGLKQAPRA